MRAIDTWGLKCTAMYAGYSTVVVNVPSKHHIIFTLRSGYTNTVPWILCKGL